MTTPLHTVNPFPGLRAFRADEDYLFFGREEQTMDLLRRLGSSRFVAVVGTSGSGKSSLVRCGLLSELLGGKMLDAGASWQVAVTHPGGNPLALLTEALLEAELYDRGQEHAREQLLATLSRSHFGLVEAVKQAGLAEGTNFLLVVDQFEEIFRFHEAGQLQQEAANEFVSLLLEAATQRDVPIYIVLTMRSDFIGECGQFEGLAEMVNRGEFLIPRLTREQYKRIIEGPIKVAGGQIAPRLLQRLLNDIGQQQDQLPCLQHALMRTWNVWSETGDSEALDLDDYQRVGRMAEALSLHADEVYISLADDRQRELCRGMFQALTVQESEGRGIRRPQRLNSLCQILEVNRDELVPIIDAYRQPGVTFLMPSAEVELTDQTIIDISHESLMRVWTRLRHWVEEEAQAAGIYRRLSESATLYRQRKAGLYRDPELGIALAWREAQRPNRAWAERYAPGFVDAMAFLEASQQAAEEEEQAREDARQHELEQAQKLAEFQQQRLEQQRRAARRLRATIAALAVVALLAVGACVSALMANANAKRLAEVANLQATAARENGERAGRALVATEEALAEVEREKKNAEQNLRKAEAAEAAARRAEDESRRLLYTTDMKLAPFVWKDEGATAEQLSTLLARHDPANQNDPPTDQKEDLRGFEWYYYRHLIEDAASVFRGHDAAVVDSAVTPDGQLVTLDERLHVRRWDLETRTEAPAGRLDLAKGRTVQTSALASDGRLAALAIDKEVHLVDTATGDELFQIDSAIVGIRKLAFSADGGLLAVLDNKIRWCDTKSGKTIATLDHNYTRCEAIALSPDGLTLGVAGHEASLGRGFSTFRLDAAGRRITLLAKDAFQNRTLTAAAISPDGSLIAMTSKIGGAVFLCETSAGGRVVAVNLSAHAANLASVAFSPDGSQLATADAQGTIKLWADPRKLEAKSEAKASFKGHSGAITKLYFLPDGKRLASASVDKTARIWDTEQGGAAIHSLASSSVAYDSTFVGGCQARYSPEGLLIASAGNGYLRLWDAETGQLVRQMAIGDRSRVCSVAFSPDNRLLALGHGESKATSHVTLWEIDTGKQLARLSGAEDLAGISAYSDFGCVTSLAFAPDGKYLVAGFGSLSVLMPGRPEWPLKVWEVPTRRLLRRLEGCLGPCTSVAFSRDGALVAAASQGGTAVIWSTADWKRLRTLENPDQDSTLAYRAVRDVAFSPDGQTLGAASFGGSVMLWDVASGEKVAAMKGHSSAVNAVAFSPDGRTLASAGEDGTVRLWNVGTRRELVQLRPGAVDRPPTRNLAFSSDGSRLLAGGPSSAFWSTAPPIWDHPDLVAERLAGLLASGTDFQVRIRALSDNPRLHEALERLGSEDPRVAAAFAAARANWHAARRRWPQAAEEFDRLKRLGPDPRGWWRTPCLLRVARALVEQGQFADAAMLLTGGAKRRIEDGAEVGLGADFTLANGVLSVNEVVRGSPAAHAGLRKGDVLLKMNDVDVPNDPVFWFNWRALNHPIGAKIRFTVRHASSEKAEEVVVASRAFFDGGDDDASLTELAATIDERVAAGPAGAALLELRALIAAQRSESEAQAADCTAALDALAAQPQDAAVDDLKRLYRLRGDAYLALKDWPKALDDYTRAAIDHATHDELTNQTLAEAEACFSQAIETLVPTSEAQGVTWRYATENPGDEWNKPDFDDSSWRESPAPFGTPSPEIRTLWSSPEIWLRRTFSGAPSADQKTFFLRLRDDDTVEVFLNGQRLAGRDTWTPEYLFVGIDKIAPDLIKLGNNTLAVHCQNNQGPGFIDVGLFASGGSAGDVQKFFDAKAMGDAWLMLALGYRISGNEQGIDKLIERRPEAAEAIGDLFADDENWQRAIDIYSVGQAFQPDSRQAGKPDLLSELLSKRARAYEHLKDWEAAAADWRRAAQGNPNAGSLLGELARRLAEAGQFESAAAFHSQARTLLEDDLRADPANVLVAEALGKLLLDTRHVSEWTVLKPLKATSELGATLTVLPDDSVLASGANLFKERYHVALTVPADIDLAAVRLEALTHPSLPNNGPGRSDVGSFAQISWTVTATQPKGGVPINIEFDNAWADAQFAGYPIKPDGHWNIFGGQGGNCTAIWSLTKPVSLAGGAILSFEMQCQTGTNAGENLGHFRLSLSSDRRAIKKQKAFATVTTGDPWARLAAAYAMHGELDHATRIAQRVLAEADTIAAKSKLLEAIAQAEDLLAAVAKTRPDDLDIQLALAKKLADRGLGRAFQADERQAGESDLPIAQRDLEVAREIFTRLLKVYPEPHWTVLKPTAMTSQGGATLTRLDEGSLLAGGPSSAKEVYEVEARLDAGPLTAIRLEGLRHETMPQGFGRGVSGQVMLTELEVEAASATEREKWQAIKFAQAWANDEQAEYPIANAIDGAPTTAWGGRGTDTSEVREAVFVAEQPFGHKAGTRLRIRLRHEFGTSPQQFGRFRLSTTGDARVLAGVVLRQADREFHDCLAALGKAYGQNGQSEESAVAFAEALRLAKDRAAKSEIIESAASLDGVLAKLAGLAPDDADLQVALARYYAAHGEPKLAAAARARFLDSYQRALDADQPNTATDEAAEAMAGALVDSIASDPDALDQKSQIAAVTRIVDPWMRLAAAYILSGETVRAARLLRARGSETIADRLDEGTAFDTVIKLLAIDPELERLSQEIARRPEATAGYSNRARYFARLGRWQESADDFLSAKKLEPQNRLAWLAAAPPLILAGDDAGYATLCREMIKQFKGTDVDTEADVLCKVCLLRPGMVDLAELPVKRVRDATVHPSEVWLPPYFLGCCELISYREGNAREAVAWADQLADPASIPVATALVLTVRALAEHQLGRNEQARQTLARASALIPQELRTLGTDAYRGRLPVAEQTILHDWLIPEILRREASALVEKNLP